MTPTSDIRTAQFRATHDRLQTEFNRLRAEHERVADQLRSLHDGIDRAVIIEQAKGIIAERHGTTIDAAFDEIRRWARDHHVAVADLAGEIVASISRRRREAS